VIVPRRPLLDVLGAIAAAVILVLALGIVR
jgi:hypothetical protein